MAVVPVAAQEMLVVVGDDRVIGGDNISGVRVIAHRVLVKRDGALPIVGTIPAGLRQEAISGTPNRKFAGCLIPGIALPVRVRQVGWRHLNLSGCLSPIAQVFG